MARAVNSMGNQVQDQGTKILDLDGNFIGLVAVVMEDWTRILVGIPEFSSIHYQLVCAHRRANMRSPRNRSTPVRFSPNIDFLDQ